MIGGKGGHDELFGLLAMSAKVLARSGDPAAFLDWIAQHGPGFAPGMARAVDPRTGPPGPAFRAMGVAIYGAMPLPEAGFQSRRLAEPGSNEPCLCGSGRKYKRCSLRLRGILDLTGYNMLRHILDERAAALLEPWFAGEGPLDARIEPLFDQLMDCYLALGQERKRTRLIARALARGAASARRSARTPRIRTSRRSSSPCSCRAARPGRRKSARGSGSRGWSAGAIPPSQT